MRIALEQIRDDAVGKIADYDRGAALTAHDAMTSIIDTAMDAIDNLEPSEPNAVVEIAPLVVVEARLDAVLRNFFKKTDRKARTSKRRDTKRDSKKRTVARKGARKVKGKR